jgi:ketosteroid isomerase-like protein
MGNVESVQALYDAFGRGDTASILDQLADDVQWDQETPSYGIRIYEPGSGKDHVKRFFEAVADDIEFQKFQPMNFLTGGDQVAVTIDIEATVKPTGKSFKALEIHLWTFDEDGKISRLAHVIDRHAVALAYGLAG